MGVEGVAVKLLDEDGGSLKYAAAYGLPELFTESAVIDINKSKINGEIVDGASLVAENISRRGRFQYWKELEDAGIDSVLFVPLIIADRVVGVLGAYCARSDGFCAEDKDIMKLASSLVAGTIENTKAFESMEKFREERSRFMVRMAHNLNAPLSGMIKTINAIHSEYGDTLNESQLKYLRRADYRSRKMVETTNELITLARNRDEVGRIEFKHVDFRLIADHVEAFFAEDAADGNILLNVKTAENLPGGYGDFEMLEQMIYNLVSNAIKYTGEDGRVDIEFADDLDETVRIEVKDNGIGIKKEDMAKIYDEFFRAENARDIDEVGTGLGLSIVKEIVELHGGRMFAKSEEGLGSIFVVHIPVYRGEEWEKQRE